MNWDSRRSPEAAARVHAARASPFGRRIRCCAGGISSAASRCPAPGGQGRHLDSPRRREMTDADWSDTDARVLGMLIDGEATDETDERGRADPGRHAAAVLNGGERAMCVHASRSLEDAEDDWMHHGRHGASTTCAVLAATTLNVACACSLVLLRYGADRRRTRDRGCRARAAVGSPSSITL